VLIARGTMGQPWIVEDVLKAFAGETPRSRSFDECREALLDHLVYSEAHKSEKGALIDMRKVSCWYFKNVPGAREFRAKASHATSLKEVREMIQQYGRVACEI